MKRLASLLCISAIFIVVLIARDNGQWQVRARGVAAYYPHPENSVLDGIDQGCAGCHGNPPDTGAHDRHFEQDIAVECTDCHPDFSGGASGGHRNDQVDFADGQVLVDTTVCDTCHGNASGVSKPNRPGTASGRSATAPAATTHPSQAGCTATPPLPSTATG